MKKDKAFFRIIFSLSIVVILAFIVGGIGKVIYYFTENGNKGMDLNIPHDYSAVYNPKVVWLSDTDNEGRIMEAYNQNIIAEDYVRALYTRNMALLNHNPEGLDENYTLHVRPKIFYQVSALKKSKITVQRAELNHNIKLHYYSADGQIVSFSDLHVQTLKRFLDKDNNRLYTAMDIADYEVIMQLEDGTWRIQSLERKPVNPQKLPNDDTLKLPDFDKRLLTKQVAQLKGINYYPQKSPWKSFWIKYDSAVVEKDLKIVKNLGLQSVRIFINYEQFGKGIVIPEMLLRLDHFMESAQRNHLKVLITLFDFNSNYELLNFPSTDRQLEVLLKRYRTHPALLAWDLKNEPDLDYSYQNKQDVKEWLVYILRQARKYDPIHPLTIGWAFPENVDFLNDELDFISFHYYKDINKLPEILNTIKKSNRNKPIVIEEFGLSNYQSLIFPIGKSEKQQAKFLLDVMDTLKSYGNASFYYWTLYDFEVVGGDIAGNKPWQKEAQKHFGLIDKNGNQKMSAKVISGQIKNININPLNKIQPFWFTYLFFGIVFVTVILLRNTIFRFLKK